MNGYTLEACIFNAPYLFRCPPNGEMKSLVVNVNLKLIYISYLWTYDLYGSLRNAFHVVNPLRGQVGEGWALEIETFLGPVK